MIRGLRIDLAQLLFQRLVFTERHRQRSPQRNTLRVEHRELLLDALDDCSERKSSAPYKTNSRWGVGVALHLYEFVNRRREFANIAHGTLAHAVAGRKIGRASRRERG